jgi:hypothetical protein
MGGKHAPGDFPFAHHIGSGNVSGRITRAIHSGFFR